MKKNKIVTWTQQMLLRSISRQLLNEGVNEDNEDDTLRAQIGIHGTENWGIIASKFTNKTTRQCRRRWFTYLNVEVKRGGWSPEEDLLLCEAQNIHGNRWTEIAKMVSGRTDNAVKNRFKILCKKRAKSEAMVEENNKRTLLEKGSHADKVTEKIVPCKKMRKTSLTSAAENQQRRHPFSVLQNVGNLPTDRYTCNTREASNYVEKTAQTDPIDGIFLKRDNPKVLALLQQFELLSTLAIQVNTENTGQGLENAWKILQDYFQQTKASDAPGPILPELEVDMNLIENLRCNSKGNLAARRETDLVNESSVTLENKLGSNLMFDVAGNKSMQVRSEIFTPQDDIGVANETLQSRPEYVHCGICNHNMSMANKETNSMKSRDKENIYRFLSTPLPTQFSSPPQAIPLFTFLPAEIPSPQFSQSETKYLMKALGLESPPTHPSSKPSEPRTCKRALLPSL